MYYSCRLSVPIRQKIVTFFLSVVGILLLCLIWAMPIPNTVQMAFKPHLTSLTTKKKGYEVFGFAPYWTMDKMQNVDFSVLTTLSYFSVDVNSDGSLNTTGPGYSSFESQPATDLFTKAHQNGTRVVLTLTQMDAGSIISLLNDPTAQQQAIHNAVALVKSRGIDGVDVDFEYIGNPGADYQARFANFVQELTGAMHAAVPSSQVSVSVLATSAKDPTLYNISALSARSDEIFLMAYDYANSSSTTAMPTSPLYGYKNGTYWYDVSTAVEDFLTQMPSQKLVLGVPWYSYNYGVYSPGVNAPVTYWSQGQVQTYATASADTANLEGWDSQGDVGWKAYYDYYAQMWRMVFVDDSRSLGLKYDFAKKEHLAGVGMWALGFDDGSNTMWQELQDKFGAKIADSAVFDKSIQE